jgi:Phage tail protein
MEKSIFNFKIQYLDGTTVDLHKLNMWVEEFHISSPEPSHITEVIEGKHGVEYLGSTLKERKISSQIMVESVDRVDFDLFRDDLFRIFKPTEKFYIIRDLQPAKRMLVSLAGGFNVDYLDLDVGEFELKFVIHSVFLESIGSTRDLFTFDSGLWQLGQGLLAEEIQYAHRTNSFRIYNAGDIPIKAEEFPLKIRYKGASKGLMICNVTTNDTWQYNGTTGEADEIILNRVKAELNGRSIYSDTNRTLISIAPGWNDFELLGTAGSFEISFDFRFYYY